jgi:ribosomal protein S18 acetylase RimI-like enzyme
VAVDENARGRGYGSRILDTLEAEARGHRVRKIVLNARDNVVEFYQKRGYEVIGDAETLSWSGSSCSHAEVIIARWHLPRRLLA